VYGIELDIHRSGDTALVLRYALTAAMDRVLIPAPQASRRAERLWQHTCFELFCTAATGGTYYELNFSPSTEWAIYAFSGYRQGMMNVEARRTPQISLHQHATGLELEARIELEALAGVPGAATIRAAASAVVEDVDRGLSYWAVAHPSGKPDFHHADAFALSLVRSDA